MHGLKEFIGLLQVNCEEFNLFCIANRQVKRDNTIRISETPAAIEATPKLDLSFKEGQTIKLNFSVSVSIC